MADAPDYFVYDGDPLAVPTPVLPRRPSVDDAGGENKLDDARRPPDPQTMPTANGHNQDSRLHAAECKLIGTHGFSVEFPAGVPGLTKFVAMSPALDSSVVTVVDNGVGDTSFTWPANTFPPQALRTPSVQINEDVAALAPCAIAIANGIRIKTRNDSAVLTDMDFTVILSGQ